MTVFLLTWNPDSSIHGWGHDALTREILKPFKKNKTASSSWRISAHKQAQIGDPVVILKQGKRPTGIFATGIITQLPKYGKGSKSGDAWRVKIEIVRIVDPQEEFFLNEYECREILGDALVNGRRSGNAIPEDKSKRLGKILNFKTSA